MPFPDGTGITTLNPNYFIMAKVATSASFKDIISGGKPVLVDFWAVWCGPCRMLSPTVDELSETYADKIDVYKCNVDDCQDIAMEYGIRSIPTLLFFKNGEVVERTVGAVSRSEIVSIIDKLI